jgi:hypothetical protein
LPAAIKKNPSKAERIIGFGVAAFGISFTVWFFFSADFGHWNLGGILYFAIVALFLYIVISYALRSFKGAEGIPQITP